MEIFIFFLWYMVWNCLPEFEPYFFWTFGDREQRCTRLHGPLPPALSGSNPPRWTQQSYPLHTWKIRDIYCYFTNYPLCNVQNMKSKFIVMCRTSYHQVFFDNQCILKLDQRLGNIWVIALFIWYGLSFSFTTAFSFELELL